MKESLKVNGKAHLVPKLELHCPDHSERGLQARVTIGTSPAFRVGEGNNQPILPEIKGIFPPTIVSLMPRGKNGQETQVIILRVFRGVRTIVTEAFRATDPTEPTQASPETGTQDSRME